jgi:hypothetical protein
MGGCARGGERGKGAKTRAGVHGAGVRVKALEWFTRPTRGYFAARIVPVGLIGTLLTALAQKSKRLSDRLKPGPRPKEFLNCNALP